MNQILATLFLLWLADAASIHWPSFRGPEASGIAQGTLPLSWNADAAEGPVRNIRWKTPIPGLSH